MHDIIPLSDDPRVTAQLQATQEGYEQWRADEIDILTSGQNPTARTDASYPQWSDEYGYGGRAIHTGASPPPEDLLNAATQDWSLPNVVRTRNGHRAPTVDLLDAEDLTWSLPSGQPLHPPSLHPEQPPHQLGGHRLPNMQVRTAHSARTT